MQCSALACPGVLLGALRSARRAAEDTATPFDPTGADDPTPLADVMRVAPGDLRSGTPVRSKEGDRHLQLSVWTSWNNVFSVHE